jgi:hypothetical protein
MAVKLLELSPGLKGDLVGCGCYRGGTTANLSLVCDTVDRHLYVYDSFEGLPDAVPGDQYASPKEHRLHTQTLQRPPGFLSPRRLRNLECSHGNDPEGAHRLRARTGRRTA